MLACRAGANPVTRDDGTPALTVPNSTTPISTSPDSLATSIVDQHFNYDPWFKDKSSAERLADEVNFKLIDFLLENGADPTIQVFNDYWYFNNNGKFNNK